MSCTGFGKYLSWICSQLFGEEDPDQDVSPDTEDPEAAANAGEAALTTEAKGDATGGIQRKSTRGWACSTGYDAIKIFNKVQELFHLELLFIISDFKNPLRDKISRFL